MLTRTQAEELVVTRLKSRCGSEKPSIADWGASQRAFGWVFEISVKRASLALFSVSAIPRWVIVNKISHQVVASTMHYNVEEFVREYEKLLAQNQALSQQWCATLRSNFPWKLWRQQTVAERAKEGGFYEIGGKEDES